MPSRPKNSRTSGLQSSVTRRNVSVAPSSVPYAVLMRLRACHARLEQRREVVDLERGVVPHRDQLIGGALLGAARDVGLAQQREEQLLGEQRVDRLRELLAEVVGHLRARSGRR